MTGIYLTDMLDVLRAGGCWADPIDNQWPTRARSSGGYGAGGPRCIMLHHTASNGNGASDANYETFVSSDKPVTNLNLGRDGHYIVCAGGATNTNGKGGPWTLANGQVIPQDQMNLWAIAIEMSNNGVGMAYPKDQIDAMFLGITALANAYLGGRVDLLCQHQPWAPTRKIDPATGGAVDPSCGWRPRSINSSGTWNLDDVIAEASRRASSPTPEDDVITDEDVQRIAAAVWAMTINSSRRSGLDPAPAEIFLVDARVYAGAAMDHAVEATNWAKAAATE